MKHTTVIFTCDICKKSETTTSTEDYASRPSGWAQVSGRLTLYTTDKAKITASTDLDWRNRDYCADCTQLLLTGDLQKLAVLSRTAGVG